MAVIQTKSSGPFGGWGGAATMLGTLTGQPWLSAIGTGMNAVDSMYGGSGGSSSMGGNMGMGGTLDEVLDKLKGWINPASGSIVKKGVDTKGLEVLDNFRSFMGGW